jgi:hypothetical protein
MIVSLTPALPEGEGDVERATRDFHRNRLPRSVVDLSQSRRESLRAENLCRWVEFLQCGIFRPLKIGIETLPKKFGGE